MSASLLGSGRSWESQLAGIGQLLAEHPEWSRWRLSRYLAQEWNWRSRTGQLKDMAVRRLLNKLQARGLIQLPARKQRSSDVHAKVQTTIVAQGEPLNVPLSALLPLQVQVLHRSEPSAKRLVGYLAAYHYLGYRFPIGQNLFYLAQDRQGRDLAVLTFGAAAWKVQSRDRFIGWTAEQRQTHLASITQNNRFLILPWVRVPYLASHLLALVLRRLAVDWRAKYAQSIYLVESFVDRSRFAGTVYQAGNWLCLGATSGRTRNDSRHVLRQASKDLYVYPLRRDFRQRLCA